MTNHQYVALVTGANKGIGREIADQLGARGMTVLVGSRDKRRGEHAAAELRSAGRDARFVEIDVTGTESVRAASVVVEEQFGRLDVLVNNAGISGSPTRQSPASVDLDVVREVFETNVFGVVAVTEAMLPLLRRSPAPRIVNMSSSLGSLTGTSTAGSYLAALPAGAGYAPSKTALNSMTVQYAKALRDEGILVNAADPGGCDTDFTRGMFAVSRSAAQGAAVAVRLATLDGDGPIGGYFDENGTVAW